MTSQSVYQCDSFLLLKLSLLKSQNLLNKKKVQVQVHPFFLGARTSTIIHLKGGWKCTTKWKSVIHKGRSNKWILLHQGYMDTGIQWHRDAGPFGPLNKAIDWMQHAPVTLHWAKYMDQWHCIHQQYAPVNLHKWARCLHANSFSLTHLY